jgi:hypothetical protein
MNAPCPKGENFADDTYFLGPPAQVEIKDLDIRDPSSRHLFRMADDEKYLMQPGDFLWAGVGCTHAFYNRSDTTVRWLETQSPLPPERHSYRFARDWEYVADQLKQQQGAT